ncbi:MAG: hypothetical protein M3O70_01230 [Actinomycetota bacterium]|nr:hypothetical protein [Actinomycetota bacterium]
MTSLPPLGSWIRPSTIRDRPIPLPDFADQEPAATQSEERAAAVEVRILGPVEISGAAPFRTNKTIELVVYLALHRAGVDTDTLLEALWPKQPPRPARLYTEASRARKALGAAPDGIPFLPDAELGRYRLSEQAALDYEQFSAHLAASRREPAQVEQHLRDALTLVRGVPLSCTATEYAWAYQHALPIAQEIVDAAHQLAQLYLDQRATTTHMRRRTGPRRRPPRRDPHPRPHGGRRRDRQHRPRPRVDEPATPPTRRRRRQQRRRRLAPPRHHQHLRAPHAAITARLSSDAERPRHLPTAMQGRKRWFLLWDSWT